jgi:hypothetical protein
VSGLLAFIRRELNYYQHYERDRRGDYPCHKPHLPLGVPSSDIKKTELVVRNHQTARKPHSRSIKFRPHYHNHSVEALHQPHHSLRCLSPPTYRLQEQKTEEVREDLLKCVVLVSHPHPTFCLQNLQQKKSKTIKNDPHKLHIPFLLVDQSSHPHTFFLLPS